MARRSAAPTKAHAMRRTSSTVRTQWRIRAKKRTSFGGAHDEPEAVARPDAERDAEDGEGAQRQDGAHLEKREHSVAMSPGNGESHGDRDQRDDEDRAERLQRCQDLGESPDDEEHVNREDGRGPPMTHRRSRPPSGTAGTWRTRAVRGARIVAVMRRLRPGGDERSARDRWPSPEDASAVPGCVARRPPTAGRAGGPRGGARLPGCR